MHSSSLNKQHNTDILEHTVINARQDYHKNPTPAAQTYLKFQIIVFIFNSFLSVKKI